MNNEETFKVTFETSTEKYSFEVSDESKWDYILDHFIWLLQNPIGYKLDRERVREWALYTEVFDD